MQLGCHSAIIDVSDVRVDLEETNHVRIFHTVLILLRASTASKEIRDFSRGCFEDCRKHLRNDLIIQLTGSLASLSERAEHFYQVVWNKLFQS